MGLDVALATLLGGAAEAAPAAAAVAPEVAAGAAAADAGAIALPEIAVTAAAPAAAATGAGLTGADVAAGLGAGSLLGITPALAGGLSPATHVAGDFAALPQGTNVSTTPLGLSQVPALGPGGAPTPTAAPASIRAPGSASVGGSGAGGSQASGHDLSGSAVDPGAAATDPALAGYEGAVATPANPNVEGQFGVQPAAASTPSAGTGAGNFFSKNAGLLGVLGAGLGGELLAPKLAQTLGLTNIPQQGQLTGIAGTAAAQAKQQNATGQTLEQPLVTGQLPPAQQAEVDQATQSAIGTIKSRYAAMGLSGSTMEASAIGAAQQNAQVIQANIESQMFQQGATAVSQATQDLNLQDTVYAQIMEAQVQQDAALQQSIGQFAAALGLGTAIAGAKA